MRIIHSGSYDSVNGLVMVLCAIHINAEDLGKLRGGNDQCRSIGESVDYRVGQEVDDQTQSQHSERQLKQSHE